MAIAVGRPLVRQRCLVKGMTRYYFLRHAGMDVKLCFGAAVDSAGELMVADGHCWLEKDGASYLEQTDSRLHFVTIYTLSRSNVPMPEPSRT
jgi:hypothetical protein